MKQLNPQQLAAVRHLDSPLLVLAGAGSGKTSVITEKIAHLIEQQQYAAENIAAITFTNKAAQEMNERVQHRLGRKATRGLTISTFHSLGMHLLRHDAPAIGYKTHFSIFDSSDCQKILTDLIASNGREAIYRAQHRISLWKNALLTPEQALQVATDDWEAQTAHIYQQYQHTLHNYQALDFDDLIRLSVRLLQENSDIRHRLQLRLRHLLIDECQDTNASQYALMKLLVGHEGRFTAVGDDDQSIYAWRGADMENLRRLQEDYPRLTVIKLEQNYRSSGRILRVANQVIANNPKLFAKTLWSQYGLGDPVRVIACQHEQHEAEYIAGEILRLKNQSGGKLQHSDFAILYRGKHQARLFEEALRASHLPYRVSGSQSFFEKAEIKDILAYLRLTANPDDDPAFLRAATTPKRGIGQTTLGILNDHARAQGCSLQVAASLPQVQHDLPSKSRDALQHFIQQLQAAQHRAQHQSAGEWIQQLLTDIAYENHLMQSEEGKSGEIKWRNVQDLAAWLTRKGEQDGKNIIELSQTIALISLLEGRDGEDIDAINLSTLHAAKGLEYPVVFLVGCEEGLFPHSDSIEEGRLEEERRLMYVGITRAKHHLTLTHCIKRKRQGTYHFPEPSRFIAEMPLEDLHILGRKGGEPIVSQAEGRQRLQSLKNLLGNPD